MQTDPNFVNFGYKPESGRIVLLDLDATPDVPPEAAEAHRVILAAANGAARFDFADRSFLGVVREQAATMAADRDTWHIPPTDTLFVQRKISGVALLAARLRAKVDVRALVSAALAGDASAAGRRAVSRPPRREATGRDRSARPDRQSAPPVTPGCP